MTLTNLPSKPSPTNWSITWRGPLAFGLLASVQAFGTTLFPHPYTADMVDFLIPAVLLALAVGLGLDAIRSKARGDRLIGLAVIAVGGLFIVAIGADCVRILRR
jgi:hypothetical protein